MDTSGARGRRRLPLALLLSAAAGAVVGVRRHGAGSAPASEAPGPVPGSPRFVLPVGGTSRQVSGDGDVGEDRDRAVLLPPGRSVVGRHARATVRLRDPSVSPEHLEVLVSPDGATRVRDLASLNGVRVDGVPVVEALLVDANRIELGAATLVFHREDAQDDGGRQGGELGER